MHRRDGVTVVPGQVKLDVAASYPKGGTSFNISKATTYCELIDIEGVSEETRRLQGINFSGGASNSTEFCTQMFGLPELNQMLDAFVLDKSYQAITNG